MLVLRYMAVAKVKVSPGASVTRNMRKVLMIAMAAGKRTEDEGI